MVGPAVKRDAVAHLRGVLEMSERRACSLVAADRKMIRYRSRRPPDTGLRARLHELANQRRRFGYRGLYIAMLRARSICGQSRYPTFHRWLGGPALTCSSQSQYSPAKPTIPAAVANQVLQVSAMK